MENICESRGKRNIPERWMPSLVQGLVLNILWCWMIYLEVLTTPKTMILVWVMLIHQPHAPQRRDFKQEGCNQSHQYCSFPNKNASIRAWVDFNSRTFGCLGCSGCLGISGLLPGPGTNPASSLCAPCGISFCWEQSKLPPMISHSLKHSLQ